MTIQSTSGTEKTIDEIALLAYQMAGLLEESQTLADVNGGALARSLFGTMLSDLQAGGISARAGAFATQTLTSEISSYTMGSGVIDVFGDAVYIPAGQIVASADSELAVVQISRAAWQTISSKSATGQPTQYYCHRETTPPVVYLWPSPDEAGTIRFQTHRHLADASSGAATVDLEKYWESYLIHELAHLLAEAKSMPADKIGRLRSKALGKKAEAKAMSMERVDEQMYVSHPTGW